MFLAGLRGVAHPLQGVQLHASSTVPYPSCTEAALLERVCAKRVEFLQLFELLLIVHGLRVLLLAWSLLLLAWCLLLLVNCLLFISCLLLLTTCLLFISCLLLLVNSLLLLLLAGARLFLSVEFLFI